MEEEEIVKTTENNSSANNKVKLMNYFISQLILRSTDFEINGIDNVKPVDVGRDCEKVNEYTIETKDDDSSNEDSFTESLDSEVDESGESEQGGSDRG